MVGKPFDKTRGTISRPLAAMLLWCLEVLRRHEAVTQEEAEEIATRIRVWLFSSVKEAGR